MTKAAKWALSAGALAALAGGALWLLSSGCQVDTQVTRPYQERSLAAEEIRAMLASGDFKRRLEASKQIDQLPDAERLTVALDLSRDQDPAIRLLAVKKLKEIADPRAKEALGALAKDDPDATVRELASGS